MGRSSEGPLYLFKKKHWPADFLEAASAHYVLLPTFFVPMAIA